MGFGPILKWQPSLIKFAELPGAVRRGHHAIQELSGVKGNIGPVILVPIYGQQHLSCSVSEPQNPALMNVQVCKGRLDSRSFCLESRCMPCHLFEPVETAIEFQKVPTKNEFCSTNQKINFFRTESMNCTLKQHVPEG